MKIVVAGVTVSNPRPGCICLENGNHHVAVAVQCGEHTRSVYLECNASLTVEVGRGSSVKIVVLHCQGDITKKTFEVYDKAFGKEGGWSYCFATTGELPGLIVE